MKSYQRSVRLQWFQEEGRYLTESQGDREATLSFQQYCQPKKMFIKKDWD